MLHVAAAPELFDRTLWSSASDERRDELARLVAAELGEVFRYAGLRRYPGADAPVAVFEHPQVGDLSLVPGGGFDMGLSPEEEEAIRAAREAGEMAVDDFDQEFDLLLSEIGQMRPLHRVVVPPFLMAQRVLTIGRALRWLPSLHDPLYGQVPQAAAHLNPEQITAVLLGTDMRLPAEAELEYAARGGLHRRLFPWGDRIPDAATVEAMLVDDDGSTHNAFGLHGYGLYPELCADRWHDHYRGAPDDGSVWDGSGIRVVRGGAADCYPWQGCGEWNLMLCAMRMNEHAAEYGAAVRLVVGLGEQETQAGEEKLVEGTGAGETGRKKVGRVKKAGVKQTGAKKTAKKLGAKKSTAKKSAAKKTAKSAAKKTAKSAAKKSAAKKPAAKKIAKSAAKKTAKSAATKSAAKKTAKSAATKSSAKKTAKPAATKSSAKKAAAKTTAKSAAKKLGAKKTAKSAAKKLGARRPAVTKAAKKSAAK